MKQNVDSVNLFNQKRNTSCKLKLQGVPVQLARKIKDKLQGITVQLAGKMKANRKNCVVTFSETNTLQVRKLSNTE